MIFDKILLGLYYLDEINKVRIRKIIKFRPIKSIRRRYRNFVLNKFKKNFVILDELKMYVEPNEYLKLVIQDHKGGHAKYLKNNIRKGDVVIDVGANIGYYTCLLSKLVGPNGHVYAFEPEPKNFSLLTKNVKMNNCTNVTIERKAVSDITGTSKLNISPGSTTGHSIYENFDDDNSIDVQTITLDDYFGDHKIINYVKSNAQGADYPMLLGMKKTLERSNNIQLWLEFDPGLIIKANESPINFLNFLKNSNFELFVSNAIEGKLKRKDVNEVLKYVRNFNGCALICKKI